MPDSGIWRQQEAVLRAKFPDLRVTSSYRPGARTAATGNTSNHALGRAIDVEPSMEIFEWIRANYPNSLELIFTPAGSRQIHKGSSHVYGGVTARGHFDHVHWAVDSLANAAQGGSGAGFVTVGNETGSNPLIPDELEAIGAFFTYISDPAVWLRVAIALGGAALLVAAFMAANKKTLDLTKVLR